jgi:sulfur carrier protein
VYARPIARSIAPVTPNEELTIELNGRPHAVVAGTTLADLVARTLPNARAFAVEVNRRVVPRRELAERRVAPGDSIEIVTLVGGG